MNSVIYYKTSSELDGQLLIMASQKYREIQQECWWATNNFSTKTLGKQQQQQQQQQNFKLKFATQKKK
jgi:hypothetical protein